MTRRSAGPQATDWQSVRALLVVLVACLALGSLPALAQESAAEPPVDPAIAEEATDEAAVAEAEEDDSRVEEVAESGEEIVVTARRREENVQEVPVAVSVVTGDALENTAATDISELQSQVPNLSIYQGRNQSSTLTAFLRGIGQADPLWGVDPGVGLYLDDVYMARPQGALLDVYDLQRIEVLRGPQGTLYGKNTIGGAIKYVSRPLTDDPAAMIGLTGGSFGTQEVRASLSGAILPGVLRGKIAVASLQRDGYGTNRFTGDDVSDKDNTAIRGALDWIASEDVTVSLSYDRTEDDGAPKGYQRLQPNFLCPLFLGTPCAPLDDRFDTQSGLVPVNGTDAEGYSLNVRWDLSPAWQFKSITAHRESDSENNIDFDTTPARIVDVMATYGDEQDSQELQFLYDAGGPLTGVLGAYYFDGRADGLVKNIFVNAQFGTTEGATDTEQLAVFADGSYDLGEAMTLNLGLRVTQEKKSGRAFNVFYSDDTFSQITFVAADYDKSETFDSIAPRLGLDYRFSDDVMGYVSLNRGFKSGGFNVRAQSTAFPESAEPFDDEILDVAEVGIKSIVADRQLVLNGALFYGKYKDIQVSTFTAYDADGDGTEESFFGSFINAGDATMKGAELEYDWQTPLDWLGFAGHVSWLEAEPDEFLDANRDGFIDTQMITNAPEWTAGLRANLDFPLFSGLLTGGAGVSYRDDSMLTNEGSSFQGRPVQPLVQEAYSVVEAWLGWLSPDARWRVGLAGKNLTDEGYITNGYNIPALGIVTGSYGQPRSVLATLEFRFF